MDTSSNESQPLPGRAWRSTLPAFGAGIVVAPVCAMVHEIGHGVALLALGYTDIGPLSYGGIGQGLAPPEVPEWAPAFIAASGPTFTLLASLAGLILAATARWVPLSLALLFAPTVEPVVDPLLGPDGAEFSGWAQVLGWDGGGSAFVVLGAALTLALLSTGVALLLRRGVPRVWSRLLVVVVGTVCGEAVGLVAFGAARLP